ncbi:NDR1/HIN1-like protein 1 [Rutidosis leptorrhynchoides]|uniref:NDR1/HIN1-like protein 1 n=1 Tax=Rutidosis leptorrhynchoides TaxID=125765 RepID=UPI003A993E00
MTQKDVESNTVSQKDGKRRKLYCHVGIGLVVSLIVVVAIIILTIYLIHRPTKPQFTLQEITLNAFNISTATTATLTSSFQITMSSRNPNARTGIFYDKLDVYATYRGQQITLQTMLPPSYLGHKDVTVWSPYLYGTEVPLASYLAGSLSQDKTAGTVLVNIKASGKVRWKFGTFVLGKYSLNVNCPAYITFGNKDGSYAVDPAVKYQLVARCSVDV